MNTLDPESAGSPSTKNVAPAPTLSLTNRTGHFSKRGGKDKWGTGLGRRGQGSNMVSMNRSDCWAIAIVGSSHVLESSSPWRAARPGCPLISEDRSALERTPWNIAIAAPKHTAADEVSLSPRLRKQRRARRTGPGVTG